LPNKGAITLLSSEKIVQALEHEGVTHVVGVPDNGSRALFERLWAHPHIEVILTSREGEAFGLASGLYLGGATPLVLIQNTGFFEAGDAFRGTAYNMGLPLVMLVGYRGYKTMEPGAPRVDTAATFFEPTLNAWQIPYTAMHEDGDIEQIPAAFSKARETSLPTAVLIVPETV
jgi:sulfopyruvate decarboxylase subunit alpha